MSLAQPEPEIPRGRLDIGFRLTVEEMGFRARVLLAGSFGSNPISGISCVLLGHCLNSLCLSFFLCKIE